MLELYNIYTFNQIIMKLIEMKLKNLKKVLKVCIYQRKTKTQ